MSARCDRQRSRVGQFFSRLFHSGHRPRAEAVPVCFQKRAYVYRRWPDRSTGLTAGQRAAEYPPSTTLN